jgi:glucose-6-phosphate 1-dehydrogenase
MADMTEITPSVAAEGIICVDTPAPPCIIVVFGASGDLAHRKLFPSLAQIYWQGLLNTNFYLLGCGRKGFSNEQFRRSVLGVITSKPYNEFDNSIDEFISRFHYLCGDYSDQSLYKNLKFKLVELKRKAKIDGPLIFYLAVPPFLYATVAEQLGSAGLACPNELDAQQVRLVVEKPFGRDLQSALDLNNAIRHCFEESQIYRIDHYLGKETVQNILMFRFANTIFEPVWNRNYIDNVQVTIAETLGVEHRASYYDKTGALRDIFQNHMLQMLTLVAMEPPVSFDADPVRDEKVKLLRSIRPFKLEELDNFIVRGQYGSGVVDGQEVIAYREEPGVDPKSRTETFVAAKLFIDNWRWKGVPFYLRTGKRLARKDTEIAITFKQVPHSMFASVGLDEIQPNSLVLQIQPEEGISLAFQAKRPGSKICMGTLNMNFSYQDVFGIQMPEAYQRLLLDCMVGDQTLFTRYDTVEVSWKLLTPVLETWKKEDSVPYVYPAGCHSFAQADSLIEGDGRRWRKLAEI